jgi:hypothetical protein
LKWGWNRIIDSYDPAGHAPFGAILRLGAVAELDHFPGSDES